MLGRYVILSAVVLAMPSFARPVGEWTESEDASPAALDFGNLESLNLALRETRDFQQDRRIAAVAPLNTTAVTPAAKPATEGAQDPNAANPTNEAAVASARTGERSPQTGSGPAANTGNFAGSGSMSFPLDVDKLRDLVEPVRAVPGVNVGNPLDGYLSGVSPSTNRAPAVLPQNDPGLAAFAESPRSTFGDRGEQTFATLGKPNLRGETDEKENQGQNEIDQEQERKDREEFEEALSDLAGRQKPYTFKDYVDYRDFVAEQGGPLGQLDLSASDFKQKAEEIFDGFEKRDVSGETAPRKALFRDFVKDPEDAAQRLIAEPKARDREKNAGTKISH